MRGRYGGRWVLGALAPALWLVALPAAPNGPLTARSAGLQGATTRAPQVGHPRLWIRAADLPRLRAWASGSNPIYRDGLAVAAAQARSDMDKGTFTTEGTQSNCLACQAAATRHGV